jgi:hypothetical protein
VATILSGRTRPTLRRKLLNHSDYS